MLDYCSIIQRGVQTLLKSLHAIGTRDKCQPDGPLDLNTDVTYPTYLTTLVFLVLTFDGLAFLTYSVFSGNYLACSWNLQRVMAFTRSALLCNGIVIQGYTESITHIVRKRFEHLSLLAYQASIYTDTCISFHSVEHIPYTGRYCKG